MRLKNNSFLVLLHEVKPMTDVVRTARDIGATTFVEYLNEAGLADRLRRPDEAYTVFAPTNEAFEVSLYLQMY